MILFKIHQRFHGHFLKELHISFNLYLEDIINDLKKSDMRKIQLTITINFISLSKDDNDEEHAINSKSDTIKIIINDEVDKVIEKLKSLKN